MESNQERLMDRLRDAHRQLNSEYPSGSWHWGKESRPGLTWLVEDAASQVDTAILGADEEAFTKALAAYVSAWRTIFKEYCREVA